MYGHTGARWDASKKQYIHKMLHATSDAAMRDIPPLFVGDFNMETEDSVLDSTMQQAWHRADYFCKFVDSRSMRIKLQINHRVINVVSVYAPTYNSDVLVKDRSSKMERKWPAWKRSTAAAGSNSSSDNPKTIQTPQH